MKRFADLVAALGQRPGDGGLAALVAYLRQSSDPDRVQALVLLSGQRPRRLGRLVEVQDGLAAAFGLPANLLAQTLRAVGSRAEMLALLIPPGLGGPDPVDGLSEALSRINGIAALPQDQRGAALESALAPLDPASRLVWLQLATGQFRARLPLALLAKAVELAMGLPAALVGARLQQGWPLADPPDLRLLVPAPPGHAESAQDWTAPLPDPLPLPCPAYLAALGDPALWIGQWERGAERAHLARHLGQSLIWTERTGWRPDPLRSPAALSLPEATVLVGEVTGTGARLCFHAQDLQCLTGRDLSDLPFLARLAELEALLIRLPPDPRLTLAGRAVLADGAGTWQAAPALARQALEAGAISLRLSPAAPGASARAHRWFPPSAEIRALLLYAETGAEGLMLTFGLPDDRSDGPQNGPQNTTPIGPPIPVARLPLPKAQQGLEALPAWIAGNTQQRFGPVRQVPATELFLISHRGLRPNGRRKAGLDLIDPQIEAWVRSPSADPPTSLAALRMLLRQG